MFASFIHDCVFYVCFVCVLCVFCVCFMCVLCVFCVCFVRVLCVFVTFVFVCEFCP